jgi:hypothetical protein
MIVGRIEKSIVIKATPEKVWEMLAFDRLSEWGEGFGEGLGERVEYTSEVTTFKDKYRVGATAQGTNMAFLEFSESSLKNCIFAEW